MLEAENNLGDEFMNLEAISVQESKGGGRDDKELATAGVEDERKWLMSGS